MCWGGGYGGLGLAQGCVASFVNTPDKLRQQCVLPARLIRSAHAPQIPKRRRLGSTSVTPTATPPGSALNGPGDAIAGLGAGIGAGDAESRPPGKPIGKGAKALLAAGKGMAGGGGGAGLMGSKAKAGGGRGGRGGGMLDGPDGAVESGTILVQGRSGEVSGGGGERGCGGCAGAGLGGGEAVGKVTGTQGRVGVKAAAPGQVGLSEGGIDPAGLGRARRSSFGTDLLPTCSSVSAPLCSWSHRTGAEGGLG